MGKIKIAFCNRPSYDNPLGGDAVQMLKTKEKLEELYNLQIDIITDPNLITKDYSIVHVFNFLTYKITDAFIKQASSLHIPIVSSCIYWDYSYSGTGIFFEAIKHYPNYISRNRICFLRNILRSLGKILPRPVGTSLVFQKYLRKFIKYSTYIAPNSLEERDLLLKFAGINDRSATHKFQVVYNGVQLEKKNILSKEKFFSKYNIPEGYILQVGRIEYLKNQLNLLYALKDHPQIPIVFVGQVYSNSYFNRILQLAQKRGNVYFISKVDHEDIASFYQYAALHVLLSLRESPGLVNLEAASLSCPIVLSDKRFIPIDTYFKNAAYVVDPLNISLIKKVVLEAYTERQITNIDMSNFSWDNVAMQTFQIYEKILKNE